LRRITRSKVYGVLTNRAYLGILAIHKRDKAGYEEVPAAWEPIIMDAEIAQEMMLTWLRNVASNGEKFRELALRIERASELTNHDDQLTAWSQHDLVAHRAARVKLLVIESLRAVDHSVAEQVERARFPNGVLPQEPVVIVSPRRVRRPPARRPLFSPGTTGALLRVSYALLAGAILFVLGYRLLH
jgi:hypothetical protein